MIHAIAIENFKSILQASFPVCPLTVLAGINSSGKSSVLQVLRLLIAKLRGETGLEDHGSIDDLRCIYAEKGHHIRIVIEDGDTPCSFTIKSGDIEKPDCMGGFINALTNVQYISADRYGPRVSYHTPKGIAAESVGEYGDYVIPYCIWKQLDQVDGIRQHPDAEATTFDHNLEAWMREVCPGVRFQFTEHTEIDSSAFRVGTKGDQTVWQRPTNVGFGLSYTLPVVATLLGAQSGELLLIENPEAHLHPVGQTKMGELLARAAAAGVQIFVETHSDHLIDGIRIAIRDALLPHDQGTVLFCTKSLQTNLSAVTAIPFLANGDLQHWPAGFCDQSIKNLSRLAEF